MKASLCSAMLRLSSQSATSCLDHSRTGLLENGLELDEDEDEEDECRSERGDAERLPNGQRGGVGAGDEAGPGVEGVGLDAGGEVTEGRMEGGVDGVMNVRAVERWVPETEGMAESLKKRQRRRIYIE